MAYKNFFDVAQLVEQRTCNAQVIGSIPIVGSSEYIKTSSILVQRFYFFMEQKHIDFNSTDNVLLFRKSEKVGKDIKKTRKQSKDIQIMKVDFCQKILGISKSSVWEN